MALNTVSSDRLSTNVKNTNFTAAEKQDLTDDILPLATQFGQSKNLIINGAMVVAQRGTSMATGDGYTADRFKLEINGTNENPTLTQADVASGTTPYTLGFRKSWKVQNGNQTGGAGATDRIQMQYRFEAQDIANSGWNYTSSSSFVTLSFWVKSSVAQTFYGLLFTLGGTSQNYPFETGSLSADTWTKVTKTIPGNSNLTFNNVTTEGLKFELHMLRGTDYTASGVTLNQWAAYASGTRTPDQTTTWYTTNDATFELTGVQLEVGSVATNFEHRPFAQELALCQRYFVQDFASSIGTMYEAWSAPNGKFATFNFPVQMRAAPTINTTNGVDGVVNSQFDNGSGGAVTVAKHASKSSVYFYNAGTQFQLTGLTNGSPGASFSAEL